MPSSSPVPSSSPTTPPLHALPVAIPVATPVGAPVHAVAVTQQPVAAVAAVATAVPTAPIFTAAPSRVAECRSCGASFVRRTSDVPYTAGWYRCNRCTTTEAVLISVMHSCTIA